MSLSTMRRQTMGVCMRFEIELRFPDMWASRGQEVGVPLRAGVCSMCLGLLVDDVYWGWFHLNSRWLKELWSKSPLGVCSSYETLIGEKRLYLLHSRYLGQSGWAKTFPESCWHLRYWSSRERINCSKCFWISPGPQPLRSDVSKFSVDDLP